jgi:hypothetical protein
MYRFAWIDDNVLNVHAGDTRPPHPYLLAPHPYLLAPHPYLLAPHPHLLAPHPSM